VGKRLLTVVLVRTHGARADLPSSQHFYNLCVSPVVTVFHNRVKVGDWEKAGVVRARARF
tara:strand:+ start:11135 stop:11314 length:180 start_codon:yes stop_codon:yes gene_type:complete